MANKIDARIRHKHDTEENWLKATNFVPLLGEMIVYDPDASYSYARIKIGDGVNTVSALPFLIEDAPFKPEDKPYLTFSSPNSFTLAVGDATKHWDGTLEYFASNKTWTVWDGTTTLSSVNNDGEYVLYLRGTRNTKIGYYDTDLDDYVPWVINGTDVRCDGNIETLLDYATVETGEHPVMAEECFGGLFQGCIAITQAPALPATMLTNYCYGSMFYGCTNLTQAPDLPATTLAEGCYSCMFWDCTSLTQAPALPATTLTSYCYDFMFYGCTSLTQVPALPATKLANYCYESMFWNCSNLTQAPALPATTLADSCYNSMFWNCSSLAKVPTLPATTLTNACYKGMFAGCTGLKLSSIQTGEYTQEYRIPITGTGTTATDALTDMFSSTGGTFIGTPEINTTYYLSTDNMIIRNNDIATLREYVGSIAAPASHASDTSIHVTAEEKTAWDAKATTTYVDQKISEIPTPDVSGQIGTHNSDSSAHSDIRESITTHTGNTSIHVTAEEKAAWNSKADAPFKPAGKSYLTFSSPYIFILEVNDNTKHWNGTLEYFASDKTWTVWDGTTTLFSVENDGEYVLYLRGTGNTVITGNNKNYKWVLTGGDISCIGNIEYLLDYATVESGSYPTMSSYCYNQMFQDCTSLTKAPALPATTLADYCYLNMFQDCTSLTEAPALPATTLADSCYRGMFNRCTALTQAPALPATTLARGCYISMFWGCTGLTQAPALPATTLAPECYGYMFWGCTSLTQAPTLPATRLAEGCYSGMFQDCTSLTAAPALPATTLATSCYESMFSSCTSLTQTPSLPATTLADYCYLNMFSGCTSLKLSATQTGEYTQEYHIPSSGTGTTATHALTEMFADTGGTFTGTPSINTTYYLSSDNMIVRETEVATLNGYVSSMIDAAHSYGTEDLKAGTSPLETGKLYFVYE